MAQRHTSPHVERATIRTTILPARPPCALGVCGGHPPWPIDGLSCPPRHQPMGESRLAQRLAAKDQPPRRGPKSCWGSPKGEVQTIYEAYSNTDLSDPTIVRCQARCLAYRLVSNRDTLSGPGARVERWHSVTSNVVSAGSVRSAGMRYRPPIVCQERAS
jgi:hypothetical protein